MHGRIKEESERSHLIASIREFKLPFTFWTEHVFTKRSNQENKFYRKFIVRALASEIGELEDSVHCELMVKCALLQEKVINEEVVYEVEQPSSMTSKRFGVYINDCIKYAYDRYNVTLIHFDDSSDVILNFHGKTRDLKMIKGKYVGVG